jgi:hypothetical protein
MDNVNIPQEYWDQELAAIKPTPTDWLWHGFVAEGNRT